MQQLRCVQSVELFKCKNTLSERALISCMCYCPFKIYTIFEQLDETEILVFTKKTVINDSHVELVVVMQKLVE